ncbi:MAG: hypothetical protein HY042_08215 [Spirochaetia bacterium]|nr:hypothetical protein [Spirochaetia bacterium]
MIIGHYATALVPYGRKVPGPLWLFLLAANFTDFLWLALVFFGFEVPEPSSMFTATFNNIRVDMKYSHAVEPTILLTLGAGLVAGLVFKNVRTGLWCGALVTLHFLSDLLVGFGHDFHGTNLGLDLYGRAPYAALFVEAAFGAVCVFLYDQSLRKSGNPLNSRQRITLYAVFIAGALMFLPNAKIPIGRLLGIG